MLSINLVTLGDSIPFLSLPVPAEGPCLLETCSLFNTCININLQDNSLSLSFSPPEISSRKTPQAYNFHSRLHFKAIST